MGIVKAELELFNSFDLALYRKNMLPESNIRSVRVEALVDSDAYMMCINENIKAQLGLEAIDKALVELADGSKVEYEITEPIDVRFLNRSTSCRALVFPGNAEILLGAIPMEDLDVIIDPKNQTLTLPPDRPYLAQKYAK